MSEVLKGDILRIEGSTWCLRVSLPSLVTGRKQVVVGWPSGRVTTGNVRSLVTHPVNAMSDWFSLRIRVLYKRVVQKDRDVLKAPRP